MNKSKRLKVYLSCLLCVVSAFCLLAGCSKRGESDDNYPAAGIWYAEASWNVKNPSFGYDWYHLDMWYYFREDGEFLFKSCTTFNSSVYDGNTIGWTDSNLTWSVKDNVITLSDGKKLTIENDSFDDLYAIKTVTLHFKKEKAN